MNRSIILPLFTACLCFRNPPSSNKDYRIFNVRIWSFLCVRMHTGVGTPTASQQNILDSEKLTNLSCAPGGRGSNLCPLNLESDALPIEPPRKPQLSTIPLHVVLTIIVQCSSVLKKKSVALFLPVGFSLFDPLCGIYCLSTSEMVQMQMPSILSF